MFLPVQRWVELSTRGRLVVSVSLGAVSYLSLVRLLRFQRVRALRRKYGDGPETGANGQLDKGGTTARPMAGRPDVKLKPEDAQQIMLSVTELEMPGLMRFALTFALFKTYAIPTITEILLQSKQLSTAENVSKRFSDTGILITTWLTCPFVDLTRMDLKTDEVDSRHAIAIARVNWLHARWPNIRNEDYIYTMSLFVLEPIRWAKLYGWRALLPIEQEAFFVLWKEVGRRMNIQDIPETLQDLIEWTERYEEIAMVPADANYTVGQYTLDYMTDNVRDLFGIRKYARDIIICLMEPRVRSAFMFPEPSRRMQTVTRLLMSYFSIKSRYFDLPRLKPFETIPREIPAEKYKEVQPRFHPVIFYKVPWYKPEPKGLGRVWQSIMLMLGVLEKEYIPGPKYKAEGFRLEECGPVALEQAGHAEVMKMAAEIQGCPVTGIWAR